MIFYANPPDNPVLYYPDSKTVELVMPFDIWPIYLRYIPNEKGLRFSFEVKDDKVYDLRIESGGPPRG